MKCKAKREIKGEKQISMKNGRPATTGTCTVCGTKMFKIGGGLNAKAKKAAKKKSGGIAPRRRGGVTGPGHDPDGGFRRTTR